MTTALPPAAPAWHSPQHVLTRLTDGHGMPRHQDDDGRPRLPDIDVHDVVVLACAQRHASRARKEKAAECPARPRRAFRLEAIDSGLEALEELVPPVDEGPCSDGDPEPSESESPLSSLSVCKLELRSAELLIGSPRLELACTVLLKGSLTVGVLEKETAGLPRPV